MFPNFNFSSSFEESKNRKDEKVAFLLLESGAILPAFGIRRQLQQHRLANFARDVHDTLLLAGIEVLDGVFDDLDIYADNAESRNKVVEIIQYAQPDVILTHNPDDYMPDHTATSKLVFDASFTATLPNWPSKTGKAAKLVPIYYFDTLCGVNFVPDEFVDITDEIDLKIQMLECHHSQLDWMREHDGIDFADMVRTCSKYRGYQCGAAYAEGFKMCKAYLKGTTKRLLP